MHLDVLDLRSFYYRTRLGWTTRNSIRATVEDIWPVSEVEGQTVVGFGFAAPILRPFLPHARRVSALMPGQQGVMPWPRGADNMAVLTEEVFWPIDTGSVDRLILLHGLETSENQSGLLNECWRVLGPGGRALFIVPNRSGLWARRERTPFGYGRPYTLGQLETQLKRHSFVPERHLGALFQLPSHARFWLKTAPIWEGIGRRLPSGRTGGIVLVEATKQIYAPTRGGLPEAIKAPLEVIGGLAKPPPKPVSQSRRSTGCRRDS